MSQYIIWNPSSNLPPRVTYPNRQEAIRVAGIMSGKNPGETFYVCKMVNSAVRPVNPSVNFTDLEADDDKNKCRGTFPF